MQLLTCIVVLALSCLAHGQYVKLSAMDPLACVTNPATPITSVLDVTISVAFDSPGFDAADPTSLYPADTTCQWHLTSAAPIQLGFVDFDLEQTPDCKNDAVLVYDGSDATGTLLATLCNDVGIPSAVMSTGGNMFVVFVSDASLERGGFLARAGPELVNTACDGTGPMVYTAAAGVFETYNFPIQYPNNELCEYLFTAPAGQKIKVWFDAFRLEDSCSFDTLSVYDGATIGAPLVAQFWGDHLPAVMISSTENLLLRFTSDATRSWLGFSGQYVHV